MDPHENIFYYYRGPSNPKSDEMNFDRQLENNTTKALVNVLKYSLKDGSTKVLSGFLQLVTEKTGYHSFPTPQNENYKFALQTTPELARVAPNKIFLAVFNEAARDSGEGTGGKPDAWIYSPGSVAIMIEAKLTGIPNEKQICGHLREAEWDSAQIHRGDLTWQEIYVNMADQRDVFLVDQFRKYLEVIGMAPFTSFVDDDFNFFISYDDVDRPRLRRKLEEFGQLVHENLTPEIRSMYPKCDLTKIVKGKESASVMIRKAQDEHDPFRHCNFTIEVLKEGLAFNTVIRDKQAMSRLHRKLQTEPRKLEQRLGALDKGFFIGIYSKEPLHGNRLMRGNEHWVPKARLSLDFVNNELTQYLKRMLERIKYPGLHISKTIERGDSILKEKQELINEACRAFQRMYPILQYLESRD